MRMIISFVSYEGKWLTYFCKNLPRTKHFHVNSSKLVFTRPVTGLLV